MDPLYQANVLLWVDDDDASHLDEEPGGDKRQAAVLAVEAVVIGVEGKVIEIEEPEIRTDPFTLPS